MSTRNIAVAIATVLTFSTGAKSEEYIRPGVIICRAGYVMDAYRIQNGRYLGRVFLFLFDLILLLLAG